MGVGDRGGGGSSTSTDAFTSAVNAGAVEVRDVEGPAPASASLLCISAEPGRPPTHFESSSSCPYYAL
jgi:hypothetical protein